MSLPPPPAKRFTEHDTQRFYDGEDARYRAFWDPDGSLHWGLFDRFEDDPATFLPACARLNEEMLARAALVQGESVLDVGCGNGNSARWLARRTGCEVVGVDLSPVRVEHAQHAARGDRACRFVTGSATELPFADRSFDVVWSQATVYHVHDRDRALAEMRRVLADGGRLVLDDLTTPADHARLSPRSRRWVYERLQFAPTWDLDSYRERLAACGLRVLGCEDLTAHLRHSYMLLQTLAAPVDADLARAYEEMAMAVDRGDLGWALFSAVRVEDPVAWVYGARDTPMLRERYDAWAPTYDAELDRGYAHLPRRAASLLAELVGDVAAPRVLDVGAGTGLVGAQLFAEGITELVGVDLSAAMLAQAQARGVYRELVVGDVHEPLALAQFDALIAVGVFTHGHVRPQALILLLEHLRAGGVLILTVREDYRATTPELEQTLASLALNLERRESVEILGGERVEILAYRMPA